MHCFSAISLSLHRKTEGMKPKRIILIRHIESKARIYWNVLGVRLGIRKVLPADFINGIKVIECKEPLEKLYNDENLFITDDQIFVGRKSMIERLMKAAKEVSQQGCRLHIFQTYRSPEEQAERRTDTYERLKGRHPHCGEEEIRRMLNKAVAGVGGGHQTGGAVDLSLCDKGGRMLDMGTQYREHNLKTTTHSKELNEDERRNRMILVEAMQRAGFVNYPAEWWHFSYGDKMWAAYKFKRHAIYGITYWDNPSRCD